MATHNLKGGGLKDFQIINKLGEGSFSTVYRVKRLQDNKEYAMKKVKLQLMKDKEKQNALNEVRILASLQNDYIVSYNEAFIDDNILYIIMEYCPNGDILKKIYKDRLGIEEKEIWKALIHMLKGLKCLHQMNILHRDIKCANIFINKEGMYKLGDLNVSKIAKMGLVYTQTGTPYYAAPEIWRDKAYDSKCDIWSLGCVLYEMASMSPPFKAMDMDGLQRKISKGNFHRIPPKYSNDLQMIIQSCLKTSSQQRPNADELLNNPLVLKYNNNNNDKKPNLKNSKLLETIKCPRNLSQLREILPKSQYQKEINNSFVETPYKDKEESKGTIQFIDIITSRTKRILSAGIGHGSIIAREGPGEVKQTIDPDKENYNFNFQKKGEQNLQASKKGTINSNRQILKQIQNNIDYKNHFNLPPMPLISKSRLPSVDPQKKIEKQTNLCNLSREKSIR